MIKSNDYWKKREAAEKEWQKQAEKNIQAYNQHIAQMYQNAIDEINRQIKSDLGFADNKLITAKNMQEYETLAKEAVKKANALRAKGHYVTRKDFSKDVNDRLKIYNATMRINRNEMLKSKIGARLVELGVEQETDLTKKLWNDYTKEKERQAGILGITAKSDLWTSKEVQGQIYKQIANANFSKRIWADIDGLKGTLDGLVSTAIIRGDNPKSMAKWLTGMVSAAVGNQRYVAERLARTETARVQFEAQQKSILDAGYKYVKWMAEGSACKLCREIAYKDNGYDENGVYKAKDVPDIPVHPNCMCSISAYWVNEIKNDKVDNISISNINDFSVAVNKLGITEVKTLNKIDPKMLSQIYETINSEFQKHPQLKGYLTTIKGGNRPKSDDIAYVKSTIELISGNNIENAKYQYKAELNLNKAKLGSIKEINQVVADMCNQHWWTKKSNYLGLIKHELAHALNTRANYAETFDNIPLKVLNFNEAKKLSKARKDNLFAEDILFDTFKKIGVKPTKNNVKKYISDYAGTNITEAFAEAYSDESQSKFSREFNKLLNLRLKKVFKL